MAKRGSGNVRKSRSTEDRIEAFAEDLGRLLGTARAKADSWLSQRQEIAKHLTDIRDTAGQLLNQLGQQAQAVVKRQRRRQKGEIRKMSAKARAAISAAQKARWAKAKAEKK